MQQLFRKLDALHREGVRGGEAEQFYAGTFYLAEAEVWLAAAEGGGDARRERPRKPGEDAGAMSTCGSIRTAPFGSTTQQRRARKS